MPIREAKPEDWEQVWPLVHEVITVGETYGFDRETSPAAAYKIWFELPQKTYVVDHQGAILGTYYLKPNQGGSGRHVCNCGYVVASSARGQGLGKIMGKHSLNMALELGYKAIQFNFVVSSNTAAIHLWKKLGFQIVGRLPKAFDHPHLGYIDALVMDQWLTDS